MKPELNHPLYQPAHDQPNRLQPTAIKGLYYLAPNINEDDRGAFIEIAKLPELNKLITEQFVIKQWNLSVSKPRVIRGFHAEGWRKLVKVISGTAYCVLADTRPESSTFLQTEHFLLGDDPHALTGSLFIAPGIANSLCALESTVCYTYGVDLLYENRDQAHDQAINVFDPTLAVEWPYSKTELVYSKRDANGRNLFELFPELVSKPK